MPPVRNPLNPSQTAKRPFVLSVPLALPLAFPLSAAVTLVWLVSAALLLPAGAQTPAASAPKPAASAPAPRAATGSSPTWSQLTPAQQQALKPLGANWAGMNEGHKRKWIALSANFSTLPPTEQATLHSRMADWASLSAEQRAQARLNFAEAKKLPADEKKAQWQAYQALSPEERQKLAAGASPKPAGAATAVKPVSPQKLATVPKAKPDPAAPALPKPPQRIGAAPGQVNQNTLLPQNAAGAPPPPANRQ